MKTAKQIAEELCPRPAPTDGRMVTGDDLDGWHGRIYRIEAILSKWESEIRKKVEDECFEDNQAKSEYESYSGSLQP